MVDIILICSSNNFSTGLHAYTNYSYVLFYFYYEFSLNSKLVWNKRTLYCEEDIELGVYGYISVFMHHGDE